MEHHLIHFPLIWGLWAALVFAPGVDWACPHSVKELLMSWSYSPLRNKARKLRMAASLSLLCVIWKERNIIVFEDATFFFNRPKMYFITSLNSWAGLIADLDYSLVRFFCAFSRALTSLGGKFFGCPSFLYRNSGSLL